MSMYWPIALIVVSNVFYNICSKQTPESIDPFASLTATYLVGAATSAAMYFALNRGGNLLREYHYLDWTSIVLGVAVVGLEAGSIYMYKMGWDISEGHILHSSILAIALIFVGFFLYHETITWTRLLGIGICLVGIFFISR